MPAELFLALPLDDDACQGIMLRLPAGRLDDLREALLDARVQMGEAGESRMDISEQFRLEGLPVRLAWQQADMTPPPAEWAEDEWEDLSDGETWPVILAELSFAHVILEVAYVDGAGRHVRARRAFSWDGLADLLNAMRKAAKAFEESLP